MSNGSPSSFEKYAVAVVGGGSGLGRQYSLDLARAGACVLVVGRGESAQRTADDIRLSGGTAAHCRADARDGGTIIEAVVASFGRVDGLIVNAGIVRDKTFSKMTDDEWGDVISVHLAGAYSCAKAAWPVMSQQGGGTILFTTSGAGLHGRFGQANYASAKAAIIGLTKTLAIEGKSKGIRVNAIAPMATTEMTRTVFPDRLAQALTTEAVSPFALALIHPRCPESGCVLEVGGGWAGKMRWERSVGIRLPPELFGVEHVLDRWNDLVDFSMKSNHPTTTEESLSAAAGFDPFDT